MPEKITHQQELRQSNDLNNIAGQDHWTGTTTYFDQTPLLQQSHCLSIWPVEIMRVITCHIDRMLLRQGLENRLGLGLQVSRVAAKSLELAGRIRAQEGQIGSADVEAIGLKRMKCLGLIHYGLERQRVGHKLVVNDGLLRLDSADGGHRDIYDLDTLLE